MCIIFLFKSILMLSWVFQRRETDIIRVDQTEVILEQGTGSG